MIGIIPLVSIIMFLFVTYKIFTDKEYEICGDKILALGINLLLTIFMCVISMIAFMGFSALFLKKEVNVVDKGGWYISKVSPMQESHKGSKGSVYTTNNFHILVENGNSYKVISLPMEDCTIIPSNDRPKVERLDTIEYNKIFTLFTGLTNITESIKYEIRIPKSEINNFSIM